MKTQQNTTRFVVALIASALLSACGGADPGEIPGGVDTTDETIGGTTDNTAGETTGGTTTGGTAGGTTGETTGSANGSTTTLPAVFSKFKTADTTCGSSVTVYLDGDEVVIESNSVPNHGSPYFPVTSGCHEADTESGFNQNPSQIATQSLTFRIPVSPAEATSKSATPMGPMGVSINGVPFFNQYAAGGAALGMEIVSFDQYGGHPQQQGMYHYHVEPEGLTASDGEDGLLGFLLDGFPVYGPMENGTAVSESSLDDYHGPTAATVDYPSGIYHYHVTSLDPYINGNGFFGTPGTVSQ